MLDLLLWPIAAIGLLILLFTLLERIRGFISFMNDVVYIVRREAQRRK
jgi:hypothetical protein